MAKTGQPTPFAELNAVLEHLLEGVRRTLGDNFVGAYLQGSFAVGDADRQSDCDFIIVSHRDVAPDELAALQALHAQIHALPYLPWRHRLEGSYAPAAILRRLSPTPRDPPGEPRGPDWRDPGTSGMAASVYPFFYLPHGGDTLVRSEHDNSQVMRWCLREKGVVMAGPDPRELVDPVSPGALRAEVRDTMDRCLAANLEPLDAVGWVAFWVGLYCRMLHTLATGQIHSKKAGSTWALTNLDPAGRPLIEKAQAFREQDRARFLDPAEPADLAATRAFVAYAMAIADKGQWRG